MSNTELFLIEAEELLSDYLSCLMIDTRSDEHYTAGHIPGAVRFCTYDQFVRSTSPIGLSRFKRIMAKTYAENGIDGSRPVVIYEEETGMRAARDAWMLQYLGHPDVRILNGGLAAWRRIDGPLDTTSVSLDASSFERESREDLIISARDLMNLLSQPATTILDVRTYDEFTGNGGSACCPRQGRLPGARWLEWSCLLDDAGRFKPVEALQQLFQAHEINLDRPVVTYCHRGARSAAAYYALKLAGCREVRNYIGSWHEWAIRNDLPIESGA